MRKHLINRLAFFLLGILLFYAPFALLVRLLILVTGSPLQADCHRVCLRMPVMWAFQPWMYSTMLEQPAYLLGVLVLPATALFFGPLFCGWLCPAGSLPEFLSRLLPDRFKLDLSGKINPAPARYGFLVGMLLAPFLGGNVCCAFCNFTHMQHLVSAATGNVRGLAHWASFTVVTFILWLVILGVFVRGGRGWCNFLCPAGALQGLAHALGARLKFGRRMRIDEHACEGCKTCVSACPAWAISHDRQATINSHACNTCMDCVHVCPHGAIRYQRTKPRRNER